MIKKINTIRCQVILAQNLLKLVLLVEAKLVSQFLLREEMLSIFKKGQLIQKL